MTPGVSSVATYCAQGNRRLVTIELDPPQLNVRHLVPIFESIVAQQLVFYLTVTPLVTLRCKRRTRSDVYELVHQIMREPQFVGPTAQAHHSAETVMVKIMSDILLALDAGDKLPRFCGIFSQPAIQSITRFSR